MRTDYNNDCVIVSKDEIKELLTHDSFDDFEIAVRKFVCELSWRLDSINAVNMMRYYFKTIGGSDE